MHNCFAPPKTETYRSLTSLANSSQRHLLVRANGQTFVAHLTGARGKKPNRKAKHIGRNQEKKETNKMKQWASTVRGSIWFSENWWQSQDTKVCAPLVLPLKNSDDRVNIQAKSTFLEQESGSSWQIHRSQNESPTAKLPPFQEEEDQEFNNARSALQHPKDNHEI